MISLAPWYYRKLLGENEIIESPEFFEIVHLSGHKLFEAVVSLKPAHRPNWAKSSKIYRNAEGSGTSEFKNIAVYKAISEALERWAFYLCVDDREKEFRFDDNPTTCGMAAFPSLLSKSARKIAKAEAIERYAIHQFNKSQLPIIEHQTYFPNLKHYQIVVPDNDIKVSLLSYLKDGFYIYSFAGGYNLEESFSRAMTELDRNDRVMTKAYSSNKKFNELEEAVDRTIFFYSTHEGYQNFSELINKAPKRISNSNPKILCDKEMKGEWNEYTKIWRYLIEDSYFKCHEDHTFFMF